MTLSAKTSLMLGVHKAGFRREGHNISFQWCLKRPHTSYIINMLFLEPVPDTIDDIAEYDK